MKKIIFSSYRFCRRVIQEFFGGGCTYRAAALAFASLLSIVPLMVVSFSILTAFPVFQGAAEIIKTLVFKVFVTNSAHAIQGEINKFVNQASKLPIPELTFLIATALIMVFNMELAFNDIWHVPERRHGVSAFLLYWAVLTLTPLLMGSAFAFGSYLISFPYIINTANQLGLTHLALIMMPTLLTFFAFTLLYISLPNRRVPLHCAAIGGLVATVLFDIAKYGLTLYVFYFPTYQLVYGALSIIPLFLIWVYCSWLIVLFGAVVSYVISLGAEQHEVSI